MECCLENGGWFLHQVNITFAALSFLGQDDDHDSGAACWPVLAERFCIEEGKGKKRN